MSNSSRIEAATRDHVGAVLTNEQIVELVKLSDPTNTKGVYPSDCAGKRLEDGSLTHRGKVQYGDLILEYLAENSFKVLKTEDIVRMPRSAKKASVPTVAVVAAAVPTPADVKKKSAKKSVKSSRPASGTPVATKIARRNGVAVQQ